MYVVERDASGNFILAPQNASTNVSFSAPSAALAPATEINITVTNPPNELNGNYDYIGEVSTLGTGSPGYILYNPTAGQFYLITNAQVQSPETLLLGTAQTSSASDDLPSCFWAGTRILTSTGEICVESLKIGDDLLTHDGRPAPLRWIGRRTVSRMFADELRILPIRVKANSLAERIPCRDLLLSPDHALLVDGILIQAGALVNGTSIVRETDVPGTFTYFHIELDDHSLVLAENAPAETFVDNIDRMAFDNWEEYLTLYPEGKTIVEMPYPRAKAYRQVPRRIRERLEERGLLLYGKEVSSAA
jgi:hypothetical protein